jgi:hypothetical protein
MSLDYFTVWNNGRLVADYPTWEKAMDAAKTLHIAFPENKIEMERIEKEDSSSPIRYTRYL